VVNDAYLDSVRGQWSRRPIIEMTIPSVVDPSLAPPGSHVVLLFTQYTPYKLANGRSWDEATRAEYAKMVFSQIDEYCPGFSQSIVGYECLPPPELERIFGLTGGNIFHGTMSLDQLFWTRPTAQCANYSTPIGGLYLCGSGAHPGGGVTGAPGRLAAMTVLGKI